MEHDSHNFNSNDHSSNNHSSNKHSSKNNSSQSSAQNLDNQSPSSDKQLSGLASNWYSLPTKRSFIVLLVTFSIIFLSAFGAKNLYFRGDYNIFFEGTNKQLMAFEEIETTFAKTDNLAIVIAPNDGNVFTPETLTLIQNLTVDSWQIPYSSRVDSLANYQHTEAIEDDLLVKTKG